MNVEWAEVNNDEEAGSTGEGKEDAEMVAIIDDWGRVHDRYRLLSWIGTWN